jgi:integrase
MKKVNQLSDILLKSLRDKPTPDGKPKKYPDGNGLYAFITPLGTISFRHDFKLESKNYTYVIGNYPVVTLKEAREAVIEAKRDVIKGINPSKKKINAKHAVKTYTFSNAVDDYYNSRKESLTPKYSTSILGRIKYNLYNDLSELNITDITSNILLDTLKKVQSQGHHETAHKLLIACGQIFRFAISNQKATIDPTVNLRGALTVVPTKHRAALHAPQDIRRVLQAIDDYHGYPVVRAALQLAPLLFVRPGELRSAKWSEIDFEAKQWVIPAEKMKMKRKHFVPLASQAIDILKSLQHLSGDGEYLFPGPRTKTTPITDVTLLNALRAMGFSKEEMTVHGFRSIASTKLNEMGYNRDWIERQLAHCESNNVRGAYNYAEYLPERHKMMQDWADYLYNLKG